MNSNIRRYSAFLALVLLLLTVFGVVWHDLAQPQSTKASCDELTCALCVFGDTLTMAILPVILTIIVAICRKTVAEQAQSVAVRAAARSFPMLC